MLLETAWRREEGMGGGRMEAGIKEELMSFTFWVK